MPHQRNTFFRTRISILCFQDLPPTHSAVALQITNRRNITALMCLSVYFERLGAPTRQIISEGSRCSMVIPQNATHTNDTTCGGSTLTIASRSTTSDFQAIVTKRI